jgi:hypothetical protein
MFVGLTWYPSGFPRKFVTEIAFQRMSTVLALTWGRFDESVSAVMYGEN